MNFHRLAAVLLFAWSINAQGLADWNRILSEYYDPTAGYGYDWKLNDWRR